jgi:hypothetical protein
VSKNIKMKIYKSIILPVVLYGCETWSLMLKEEHRLMVFENRVLKRIFGLKRDRIVDGWRNMHDEDLYNLYLSLNIIKIIEPSRMRYAGHVACMGEKRNAYKVVVGKLEGKRPLGIPQHGWEDNIKN